MKKLYILALVFACFVSQATAQTVNVTFRVTLKGTGKKLSADGLRVTGALGVAGTADWSPGVAAKMLPVGAVADSIYAITLAVTRPATGVIEYKFINGNNWGDGAGGTTEDERGLAGLPCATAGGNRTYTIAAGATTVLLPTYRFNTCTTVFQASVNELTSAKNVAVSPNPMTAKAILTFDNVTNDAHSLELLNLMGQVVGSYAATRGSQFDIERGSMTSGIYFARLNNSKGESKMVKFSID